MQLIAEHILTMTPDYVLSWGVWEAVRELLQNALDQHRQHDHSQVIFDFDTEVEDGVKGFLLQQDDTVWHEKRLVVGATNCRLEPQTLLLGKTTKALNRDTIGEFGEGYKLALLVLTRLGHKVTIHNCRELWQPEFRWCDEYGCEVLSIKRYATDLAPDEEHVDGVLFEIEGVTQAEFDKVVERYIPGVPDNVILEEDYLRHKVFVGQLFVCEIDELEYGYNFAPGRVRLDRDRGMASTFDVSLASSGLWSQSGAHDKLYDSMMAGALDVSYVSFTSDASRAYMLERYMRESGGAIPVSGDAEANMLAETGHTVRRVPTALRNLVRSMHKFVFNRSGTPTERLERFEHQFGHLWGAECKREFRAILEASTKWHGPGGLKNEATVPNEVLELQGT